VLWLLLGAVWLVGSLLVATVFGSMARGAERRAEVSRLRADSRL